MTIRIAGMFLYLMTILMINFLVQGFASQSIDRTLGKYDRSVKCSEIYDMYSNEDLELMASDEYFYYYKDGYKFNRKIQPTLQCFCL